MSQVDFSSVIFDSKDDEIKQKINHMLNENNDIESGENVSIPSHNEDISSNRGPKNRLERGLCYLGKKIGIQVVFEY